MEFERNEVASASIAARSAADIALLRSIGTAFAATCAVAWAPRMGAACEGANEAMLAPRAARAAMPMSRVRRRFIGSPWDG